MQSFTVTSPVSNVANIGDVLALAATLDLELCQNNSVTVSGQFQLDIQTGNVSVSVWPPKISIPPPDPRPVFDWSITISLDGNTQSITLEIDITYDHMESDNLVEVLAAAFLTLISGGLLDWIAGSLIGIVGGTATGIEVGQTLTQAYNASLDSQGGETA